MHGQNYVLARQGALASRGNRAAGTPARLDGAGYRSGTGGAGRPDRGVGASPVAIRVKLVYANGTPGAETNSSGHSVAVAKGRRR